MCEALENLMKDKLEESKNEGALAMLYDLVKQGLLDIKNAALQANMSEAAFIDGMNKYRA